MIIANPIYDTVFKYMMSDSRVAKTFLSAIIGEKIVELDFTSTEYTLKTGVEKSQIDRTYNTQITRGIRIQAGKRGDADGRRLYKRIADER